MSNFSFLEAEWSNVHDSAAKAERDATSDPRTSCFYARRAVELMIHWLYKADASLVLPYQDSLSALVHEPTFKDAVGETIFNKVLLISRIGNRAVHDHRAI